MRSAMFLGLFGAAAALVLANPVLAQEQAMPDGPGKEKIVAACTACHAISQVTSQRRSAASWGETVDQMISRGAEVSDAEYPVVVAYLSKHFGTEPTPAKP